MQIEGEQNTVLTVAPSLSDILSATRGRIKNMTSNFAAPQIACEDYSRIETGLYLTGLLFYCCF